MQLLLWCLHLQLRPFRLLEGGQPQPADYIVALLWLWLLGCRTAMPSSGVISYRRSFKWLVAYVVLTNVRWWMTSDEPGFLVASMYFLYNYIGCDTFIKMYSRYGKTFLQFTAGSICLALFVQFVAATGITTDYGVRETLFFTNPNQLGYYVVLSLSVMWACWTAPGPNGASVPAALEVVVFGCAGYLMLLSQSRAGFAAICVVLLGRVLSGRRLLVGVSIAALVALTINMDSSLLTTFRERSQSKSREASEEMSLRGYDRIINHPQYLLFGAGEGEYDRFESGLDGELHSSFGTIAFSYGLVGLLLAFQMVRSVVRAAGITSLLYLAPVATYSLTHNGLRQLEMWWLMPLIIYLNAGCASKVSSGQGRVRLRRHRFSRAFATAQQTLGTYGNRGRRTLVGSPLHTSGNRLAPEVGGA